MELKELLKSKLGSVEDEKLSEVSELLNQHFESEIAGLKKNKDEIKSEKEQVKKKLEEMQKTIDKYKDMEYNYDVLKQQAQVNSPEGLKAAEELAAVKSQLAKTQREIEARQSDMETISTERDNYKTQLHDLLTSQTLRKSYTDAGVAPDYIDVLITANKGKARVVDGEVLIHNDGKDQPADMWVKTWADGDKAKAFIKAPQNSGGNARGGIDTSKVKSLTDLSLDQAQELYTKNPKLYEQLKGVN